MRRKTPSGPLPEKKEKRERERDGLPPGPRSGERAEPGGEPSGPSPRRS